MLGSVSGDQLCCFHRSGGNIRCSKSILHPDFVNAYQEVVFLLIQAVCIDDGTRR